MVPSTKAVPNTEKGGNPHPEQGSRSSYGNGPGDSQDVPRTHPHGGTEHKGGQRRYPRFCTAPADQETDGLPHVGQLDAVEPQGKVDPRPHQDDNGERKASQQRQIFVPGKLGGNVPEKVRKGADKLQNGIDPCKQIFHEHLPHSYLISFTITQSERFSTNSGIFVK